MRVKLTMIPTTKSDHKNHYNVNDGDDDDENNNNVFFVLESWTH